MCIVSNIGDGWGRSFPDRYPWAYPQQPTVTPNVVVEQLLPPSRAEFDRLKAEVEQLRALLLQGKAFDEATGQPDCHNDEKVALIRKIAELVGVDMSDVFGETG